MKPTSTLTYSRFRGLSPVLLAALVTASLPVAGVCQTPGSLDLNFDTDGRVAIPFATGPALGYSVIERFNTDIYLVGRCETTSGENIAISRIKTDGSLDLSFDGDGKILASEGAYTAAYGGTREAGGKVIVTGHTGSSSSDHDLMVARFNTDGTLDNTFGNGGFVSTTFTPGSPSRGWDVSIQSDGKIIVAGWSGDQVAIARYLNSGGLDPSFSVDGKILLDFSSGADWAHSVALADDGDIYVVGGFELSNQDRGFLIGRLNSDGTLDNAFGNQGRKIILSPGPAGPSDGWGCIVDNSNRLVFVGAMAVNSNTTEPVIFRLENDGDLDTTFSADGFLQLNSIFWIGGGYYDIVQLEDNKYLCAGFCYQNSTSEKWLIDSVLENGSPDQGFGLGGGLPFFSGSPNQRARSIIRQEINGSTLVTVGGYAQETVNDPMVFAAARLYPNLTVGILEFGPATTTLNIYPNPISESATLTYTLAEAEELTIALHDLQGRALATYLDGKDMPAGEHTQTITLPEDLAAGNYLVVLSSPKGRFTIQVGKQ